MPASASREPGGGPSRLAFHPSSGRPKAHPRAVHAGGETPEAEGHPTGASATLRECVWSRQAKAQHECPRCHVLKRAVRQISGMPNAFEETEAQKDQKAAPTHAELGCIWPRGPAPPSPRAGHRCGTVHARLPHPGGRQDAGLTCRHRAVAPELPRPNTPARTGLLEPSFPHSPSRDGKRPRERRRERASWRGARSAALGLLEHALVQQVGVGHRAWTKRGGS